ncbi:MAG: hypothetical protein KatS3mg061_1846 [Dehalococcoidia bacterium]|nr:MAG: hypothetical protein KatS3mg061_1846 [Dehalococcoidia bacterium]
MPRTSNAGSPNWSARAGPEEELAELRRTLATAEELREANPMLGLRGCRLGILYPDIYAMQVRAILNAAADLLAEQQPVRPEIMIPLVGHVNELKIVREQLEAVAYQVQQQRGVTIPYQFGTMIEVPRAALTADEIAQHAEFFSFGTNDLTQMTLAISRDDAEGKFLLQYVERKILPFNPFQQLDQAGVGKLIALAVNDGRRARPDLQVGVCGEHGGDPRQHCLLPYGRPRLRLLLAVPRPRRPACGGAGRAHAARARPVRGASVAGQGRP